jgi:hypothetical protein
MRIVRHCSAMSGLLVIALAFAIGVVETEGDPPLCPSQQLLDPTPPPVTTLRTRDAELAIYAVDGELRYTVIERTGRIAMHMGTERDFVVHFPRLAAHVEAAFAEDGAWVDASRSRSRHDEAPGERP